LLENKRELEILYETNRINLEVRNLSLQYGLLGLLNYKSMTGYDLKQLFDNSLNFFWSAHVSQIYRELNSLEKNGFITSKIEPQEKRPDRKVYDITQEGRETFFKWLTKFPEQLNETVRSEFVMRVFFSNKIGLDELAYEIKRYKKENEQMVDELKNIEKETKSYGNEISSPEESFFWLLTLKRGYANAEAAIKWAEESLKLIEDKKRGS